jgi:hypothetical protein
MGDALFLEVMQIFDGLLAERFLHAGDYSGQEGTPATANGCGAGFRI